MSCIADDLYKSVTAESGSVLAATYVQTTAAESVPVDNPLKRVLDTFFMPALPQEPADVSRPPLFALSQEPGSDATLDPPGNILGIVTLEGDITDMTSIDNAPKLRAQLLENGFNFPTTTSEVALRPLLPQVGIGSPGLDAGDLVGVADRGTIRTYGVGSV
jgi:hypothetical protein